MYFKIEQSVDTLKTILSYFCLIYLFSLGSVFLAVLAFSSYCEWGLLSSCSLWASHCCGFSCCEQALGTWALVLVAQTRSCSVSCGIFPDQGSDPCPLPWQVDS